jgi:ElaB/YqjD/DUF883 family membrane-anchored ribosome-binding protein
MGNAITENRGSNGQSMAKEAHSFGKVAMEALDNSGIREKLDDIKDLGQRALSASESTIRRYPYYSLLGAAAVGAVTALLFSRRSSD